MTQSFSPFYPCKTAFFLIHPFIFRAFFPHSFTCKLDYRKCWWLAHILNVFFIRAPLLLTFLLSSNRHTLWMREKVINSLLWLNRGLVNKFMVLCFNSVYNPNSFVFICISKDVLLDFLTVLCRFRFSTSFLMEF